MTRVKPVTMKVHSKRKLKSRKEKTYLFFKDLEVLFHSHHLSIHRNEENFPRKETKIDGESCHKKENDLKIEKVGSIFMSWCTSI